MAMQGVYTSRNTLRDSYEKKELPFSSMWILASSDASV